MDAKRVTSVISWTSKEEGLDWNCKGCKEDIVKDGTNSRVKELVLEKNDLLAELRKEKETAREVKEKNKEVKEENRILNLRYQGLVADWDKEKELKTKFKKEIEEKEERERSAK